MSETMENMKRTHMCSNINEKLTGKEVTVMGWVNKKRNLGQLVFIALRDITGIVQIVLDGATADDKIYSKAESLRGEYVIAVKGIVRERSEANINPDMETGRVEIEAEELRILSEAEVPPFQVFDTGVKEDLRLKYRYLDLRRPDMQKNFIIRHKTAQIIRQFLNEEGAIEIETPVLTKSTPEGARDYLVPSRIHPGNFYALPQSPQVFKQLLMVSGFDKYYQLVKCFRDEDLRADRQPEFTQIDIEMSFVNMQDIMSMSEKLMQKIFKDILDIEIETSFLRMPYSEAMERFGSDKPDMRFGMELKNITEIVTGSEFKMFEDAIQSGGSVRGINAENCGKFTRKQIDALIDFAKSCKAKGLAYIVITETGELKTSLTKFFDQDTLDRIVKVFDGKPGDLIFICADKGQLVFDVLGSLRVEIANRIEILDPNEFKFLWITEIPLFEYSEEDGRFYAKHHPFTNPVAEDIHLFDTDNLASMRAEAYDMVLNGVELSGGSMRINRRDLQEKMFKALGFTMEEAYEQFAHLLEAFKYGTPPHGGIAGGLDRLVMFLTGSNAIRDVIAFPKVKDASCPMTNAPNIVSEKQLNELGIAVKNQEK